MKFSLCNEVIREMNFEDQCRFASELGYAGLEVAPFTLSGNPHILPAEERVRLRRAAEKSGIEITSLHWLLLVPEGLSITSPDRDVRERTLGVMSGLVNLCSDLGGRTLVHGSPGQRNFSGDRDDAMAWAAELFSRAAEEAGKAGVVYCIEPLTDKETNFVNTIAEAVELVEKVGSPYFRTMLDTKAASGAEKETITELIHKWVPSGMIRHVHLNDPGLSAPGQGELRFRDILAALEVSDYQGVLAVEPFDYFPDGRSQAARAIGYLQGVLEGIPEKEKSRL